MLGKRLGDEARYLAALERIYAKYLKTGRVHELQQEEVTLAQFNRDRHTLCKILADSVSDGSYQLSPGRLKRVKVEDKIRILFSFNLTDLIVHAVVSQILTELAEPFYSSCLYSYRKKLSTRIAIDQLAIYVKSHRRKHANPHDRGLFVLKRDIQSYTDSIPVHQRSRVWELLGELFQRYDVKDVTQDPHFSFIQKVIRPEVIDFSGGIFTQYVGTPTGSPISVFLFNFYLADFDADMENVKDVFYLRYSDDFIILTENKEQAIEADSLIKKGLTRLQLGVRPDKAQDFFFNGAGKKSPQWSAAQGISKLTFLGWSLRFDSSVGLSEKKCRRFRQDLRERIFKSNHILNLHDLETRGRLLALTINEVFKPSNSFAQNYSGLIFSSVTDRIQLKEFDYWIARVFQRALIGVSGVRAFRLISYRKIRKEWGLISLVYMRDRSNRMRDSGIQKSG